MTDWQPMETAPKDRLILGWCNHEADPYLIEGTNSLTTYGAHCEGLAHAEDGFNILVWGGELDDEEDGYIPNWWFVKDTEWEVPANPILWAEITEPKL